jgi:CBS domain-containing protein
MHLKDVMACNFETIAPEATLQDAARKMSSQGIGFLPVIEGRQLVGTVTYRDIVVRGVALGHDPTRARVHQVMTSDPISIWQDCTAEEAIEVMEHTSVQRLPVRDETKQVVGVVAWEDLVEVTTGRSSSSSSVR